MAGHSKWANIKHRKGRQDEKKQKIFSKLIRAVSYTHLTLPTNSNV